MIVSDMPAHKEILLKEFKPASFVIAKEWDYFRGPQNVMVFKYIKAHPLKYYVVIKTDS